MQLKKDGFIPKDVLHGELITAHHPVGRPALRFKDVCRRDLKLTGNETLMGTAYRRPQQMTPHYSRNC